MPDQWLVEMSGIPYGMHAEQLSAPNLWRGMVFAEGARPAPALWKAWDALHLTMEGVELRGWWEERVSRPLVVSSGDTLVPASAFIRPETAGGGIVIAVASWRAAGTSTRVTLTIDWEAIGLSATHAVVTAPAIDNFQAATTFAVNSDGTVDVTVLSPQGWLIEVRST